MPKGVPPGVPRGRDPGLQGSDSSIAQVAAYRANALFDAHREDPEFGYRFLDEARDAGQPMAERTAWRTSLVWRLAAHVRRPGLGQPVGRRSGCERVRCASYTSGGAERRITASLHPWGGRATAGSDPGWRP